MFEFLLKYKVSRIFKKHFSDEFVLIKLDRDSIILKIIAKYIGKEINKEVVLSKASEIKGFIAAKIGVKAQNIMFMTSFDTGQTMHKTNQKPLDTTKKIDKTTTEKKTIGNSRRVIAVSSCKGGVGKSTISFLLANVMSKTSSTAILDLDIYGPSIPTIAEIESTQEPNITDDKKIIPIKKDGISICSVGMIVDKDASLVWRGPIVTKMINSMILKCDWSGVETIIIDLPPGTGDAYLSLFENYKIDEVILVSTPEKLAIADLRRSVAMFKKLDVKISGLIQNMSNLNFKDHEDLEKFCKSSEIKILSKINFIENIAKDAVTIECLRQNLIDNKII